MSVRFLTDKRHDVNHAHGGTGDGTSVRVRGNWRDGSCGLNSRARPAEQLIVCAQEGRPGDPAVESSEDRLAGSAPHSHVQLVTRKQPRQLVGKGVSIVQLDEISVVSILDDFVRSTAAGRNHRNATGHRLYDYNADSLFVGGQGKH